MNDTLTFRDDKVLSFIFSKIVSLETELILQKSLTTAIYKHSNTDEKNHWNLLMKQTEVRRPIVQKSRVEVLASELSGMSDDFDNFLQDLINPK